MKILKPSFRASWMQDTPTEEAPPQIRRPEDWGFGDEVGSGTERLSKRATIEVAIPIGKTDPSSNDLFCHQLPISICHV